MTRAWLLARVGQAAGFQFAGLSRWRRREQSLGVPTPQAPGSAAEAGAAPRFPPLPSASSSCATPSAKTAFGISRSHPAVPGTGKPGIPLGGSFRGLFHLEGFWLPHVEREEADVREKDAQRNTQRPAAGEETKHQEQGSLEQPLLPRNAGRAFGLCGLCRAPPLLVTGVWMALGGLQSNIGRAGFSEDAAGKGC